MGISTGGLATGLDTTSIISSLMALERKPIERMTQAMTDQSSRLAGLGEFNGKLSSLLSKVEPLGSSETLRPMTAKLGREGYLTATAGTAAVAGSYQVKTFNLAQVEKVASQDGLGWADKDAKLYNTGTLVLRVGGVDKAIITIDGTNNSLAGIAQAINAANTGDTATGVAANIINDGDEYRLVLTGATVNDKAISLDATGLNSGTGSYANPALDPPVQLAQRAHIEVDGISIYSDTNSFTEAIPGVTLNLTKADGGAEVTSLTVSMDQGSVKKKIQEFIAAVNGALAAKGQGSDTGLRAIQGRLRELLTTQVDGGGKFGTLSEIGIETQRDGSIKLNDSKLDKALSENPADLEALLVGKKGADGSVIVKGIAAGFKEYLKAITDSTNGFYAGRKQGIDSTIKRLNSDIERMEARLELRQQTLTAQFTNLEKLVSNLKSQGSYLSQQLSALSNSGSNN